VQAVGRPADTRFVLGQHASIVVTIVIGAALEIGIHAWTGRAEAWDAVQYWTVGLPLAGLACAAVGFLSRGRHWLWTCLLVPSQVMTTMLRSGEVGNLWPLTLILSTLLSTPFVVASFVGSTFRRAK
jgi:hypothetical protein